MTGDKHWSAVSYRALPLLSKGDDYIMPKRHLVRAEDIKPVNEFRSEPITASCGVSGSPVTHPMGDRFNEEHPVCRKCLKYTDVMK